MCLKAAPVSTESFQQYSWSLKPFLIWLKVLGIHLPVNQTSLTCRLCFIFYSVTWLTVNVSANVYSLRNAFQSEDETDRELATVAYSWTKVIAYCNMAFSDVVSHFGLLFIIQPKWKNFRDVVERIELEFNDRCDNYRKCRYVTLASLVYIIFHGTMHHAVIIYDLVVNYSKNPLLHKIGYVAASTMEYFSVSGWAFFCLLGWMLPLHLQNVVRDIDHFQLPPDTEPAKSVDERLRLWKRQFGLVNECLHLLNESFGILLFVHTTSVFVTVISRSFFMTVTFLATGQTYVFSILVVVEKCVLLWITCSVCDRIHSQNFAIARALIQFHSKLVEHHQSVMDFVSHVSESGPKMSAMGYFRVSRHLFPKLVGTSLTYFIILYQFQFSEKKTPKA